MLDAGCKTQPSVARSSGESETTALHDVVLDLTGVETPTPAEKELIDRTPDRVKALTNTLTRMSYPLEDLLRWLTCKRVDIQYGGIYVDATVCKSVAEAGESKAMSYVRKTQTVDLLWLRDAVRHLRMSIIKISSERNVADLLTKAVTRKVLMTLLPIIGRA